jgi:hypothetical protein
MTSRQYALTRLRTGDYLCPSNDRTTLWRFRKYWEDGSLEDGNGGTITGHFWEVYSCPLPTDAQLQMAVYDDPDLWTLPWQTAESLLKTRREAIEVMER